MKVVAEDAATQRVEIESKISTDTLIPWDSSLADKTSTIYQQKSEEIQTAFKWRLTSAGAARGLTLSEIIVDFYLYRCHSFFNILIGQGKKTYGC